jgi:hypothetical protein
LPRMALDGWSWTVRIRSTFSDGKTPRPIKIADSCYGCT